MIHKFIKYVHRYNSKQLIIALKILMNVLKVNKKDERMTSFRSRLEVFFRKGENLQEKRVPEFLFKKSCSNFI